MVPRLSLMLVIAVPVLLADQATKALAVEHLGPVGRGEEVGAGREVALVDGLLTLRLSPSGELEAGVSRVLPPRVARPLLLGAGLLALAFLVWLTLAPQELPRRIQAGLAVLIGGAGGNFLDRLLHGQVMDWLQWQGAGGSASFTLGDVGIWGGMGLLVLELVRPRGAPLAEASTPPALPGV